MLLKDISVFHYGIDFAIAYKKNDTTYCTETFESDSEWYADIIANYGDVEIELVTFETRFHNTALFYVPKEICFDISRKVMNRYMDEDNSWEEIA